MSWDGGDLPAGPLFVLTGTELEVLETAHLRSLTDHLPEGLGLDPGHDPPDPDDIGAAWVEAIGSLTARGLLDHDGELSGTAAGLLVRTLLDVRLGATALVVVERLLGGPEQRRDLRLLHLVELGAVVEDLPAEGHHGLDLVLDPDLLVEDLVGLLVPPDASRGDREGSSLELDPQAPELMGERLGHPTVLVELTLVRPGAAVTDPTRPEEAHLVALGPSGCWAARREQAPGPGGDQSPAGQQSPRGGPLTFRAVGPDWVRSTVTAWVGAVLQPGEEAQ